MEVRVTVESHTKAINLKQFKQAFISGLQQRLAPVIISAMQAKVADWIHQPDFIMREYNDGSRIGIWVGPVGENRKYWAWVSLGAKGKTYTMKEKKMRFRSKYVPKTQSGNYFFKGGGQYSGEHVYVKVVHWPGIAPRFLEANLIRIGGREYQAVAQQCAKDALKVAGG